MAPEGWKIGTAKVAKSAKMERRRSVIFSCLPGFLIESLMIGDFL
jgi:hypothetical protein